jgi:hypothetical protein
MVTPDSPPAHTQSSEYLDVLIHIDEMERNLIDFQRFDVETMEALIQNIDDLGQLARVRHIPIPRLQNTVAMTLNSIERIRGSSIPVLPELKIIDEKQCRIWYHPPNKWSEVKPDDIHAYDKPVAD